MENKNPQLENIDDQIVEKEIENDQTKNIGKIKLLGVDQDGRNITLFIHNKTLLKSSILALYDKWGQELERLNLDVTKPKIRLKSKNIVKENMLAFVQFIDSENESQSNKQVVNKLHELCITTPLDLKTRYLIIDENDLYKKYEILNKFVEKQLENL